MFCNKVDSRPLHYHSHSPHCSLCCKWDNKKQVCDAFSSGIERQISDQGMPITTSLWIAASYPALVSSHDSSMYFLLHLTLHYVFLTQCFVSHCTGLLSNAWPSHTSAGTESLGTLVGWKVSFECCPAKPLYSVTSRLLALVSILLQICRWGEIISSVSNTTQVFQGNVKCHLFDPISGSDCCLVWRH